MNMVNEFDAKRIANDAEIAINSLQAIICCANEGYLHESYLREKARIVKSCIEFMQSFYEEEE